MDRHKIWTQIGVGQDWKRTLEIFVPPLKIWQEKPWIYLKYYKTAGNWKCIHIGKRIADVSSTINLLKDGTKLGGMIHGVLMQPREKTDKMSIN